MTNRPWVPVAFTACSLCNPDAQAQFSGPYSPSNWTFSPNGGNGFVNTSSAPASISLTGNDNQAPAINTDYTVIVPATGLWSFDWDFVPTDKGTFDSAYYLINNVQVFLSFNSPPSAGSVINVPVTMGDVIGFRVYASDGAIGPGTLVITNFSAPVPGPGGVAVLLGPAVIVATRTRRRPRRE